MKYYFDIGPKRYSTHSALPKTHVVIGQIDIERERPPKPEKENEPTQDELVALRKFAHDSTRGRYAMQVIEWCGSEKEAQGIAANFANGNEWINVEVRPLNGRGA